MFTEKRRHKRQRVLRNARIVLPGGNSTLSCVLLDISNGGARLRTEQWLLMPDRFHLSIEDGLTFPATVRYRENNIAGVEFLEKVA